MENKQGILQEGNREEDKQTGEQKSTQKKKLTECHISAEQKSILYSSDIQAHRKRSIAVVL